MANEKLIEEIIVEADKVLKYLKSNSFVYESFCEFMRKTGFEGTMSEPSMSEKVKYFSSSSNKLRWVQNSRKSLEGSYEYLKSVMKHINELDKNPLDFNDGANGKLFLNCNFPSNFEDEKLDHNYYQLLIKFLPGKQVMLGATKDMIPGNFSKNGDLFTFEFELKNFSMCVKGFDRNDLEILPVTISYVGREGISSQTGFLSKRILFLKEYVILFHFNLYTYPHISYPMDIPLMESPDNIDSLRQLFNWSDHYYYEEYDTCDDLKSMRSKATQEMKTNIWMRKYRFLLQEKKWWQYLYRYYLDLRALMTVKFKR